MTSAPAVPERDRSIDIARMVAAALIVAYHAGVYHTAVYYMAGSYELGGGPKYFGLAPAEIVGVLSLWGRVPFFFFLSGYFAARTLAKGAVSGSSFIRKRFELLGLPYLFWNTVACAMLYVGTRHGADLLNEWVFTPKTVAQQITGFGKVPADIPLWFVRDLLLASCLAPLIFRIRRWLLLPFVAMVFYEEVPPDAHRMIWPLVSSFGYFGLGMLLNDLPKGIFSRFTSRPTIPFLVFLGLGAFFLFSGLHVPPLIGPAAGAAQILLAGCFIYRTFPRFGEWLGGCANASFLIFAANMPFFAIARQLYLKLPPGTIPVGLFFTITAIAFYFAAIAVHRFLCDRWPVLLKPLTGGR